MTFVDTSAWYAFFIQTDPDHRTAYDLMAANRFPLFTTDYVIDEVQIINRPPPGPADRFVHFGIETSADAASWINRWIKLDSAAVSHDPAAPHRVVFSTPCVGRFLRINQLGSDCLHLRRVHVFGRAIVPID